jgi:sulfate transport system permease protein
VHAFEITLIATNRRAGEHGIRCALRACDRARRFRGKALNAFIDLPLALSPVVVGLALFLLYSRTGWFGLVHGSRIQVLFALPAIVLATIFVSVPFVAREVIPTLRELGNEQEQAAATPVRRAGSGSGASRCRRSAGP